MPRSENYSTDSVQSFKSNFREHLAISWCRQVEGKTYFRRVFFIIERLLINI